MKPNRMDQPIAAAQSTFAHRLPVLHRSVVDEIARARATITAEFEGGLNGQAHLLHLAMNEAEALAWQTSYPHLIFPTLATEKAQAISNWHTRQQVLRGANAERAFAA